MFDNRASEEGVNSVFMIAINGLLNQQGFFRE